MRIPRLRLAILAAAAVVGGTAAVALGAPTRTQDNVSDIQHAFAKTAKVTSAQFAFRVSISGGATQQTGSIAISGNGAYDTKHQVSKFTVDLGPLAAALGSLGGGKASIPQKVDVVTLKSAVYIHLPALAVQAGGKGKEWLKLDVTKLPKSSTGGISASQVGKTSPAQVLAALKGSIAVHKLGSTTVQGESMTHYRVNVNATKLITSLVPKAQQASSLKSLRTAGVSTIPADVYVDHSGYARSFQVTLKNLKTAKGSPPSSVAFSFNISGIGASVHASAPPASKTADGTKLLSSLAGSVGGG